MGKRSRNRGASSGGGSRPQGRTVEEPEESFTLADRAKASWQVASEHSVDRDVWRKKGPGARFGSAADRRAPARGEATARAAARTGKATGKRPTKLDQRGERPPSLFGKWPVTEVLTLVGIVVLAAGLIRGARDNPALIEVGVICVALAALESAVREHLFGYRSHALFLALLVVILFHLLVALIGGGPAGRSDLTFVFDVVLFALVAVGMHRLYRSRQAAAAVEPRTRRPTPKPAGGR